eukprot:gnl/TRDRNA2_/TRDRNA2_164922_c0_seq5.p1 gnl/TRDRNA2_/TRDRNA2_164922_c0~~gnl/TRDRNA2_/TRDRNA2_164922_c0_seq5.p1  ORF type:complete len:131 (-),score=25.43 gnl/TRDRNA2_/TRDRNA2_164922_c0_seq5:293-685(-)
MGGWGYGKAAGKGGKAAGKGPYGAGKGDAGKGKGKGSPDCKIFVSNIPFEAQGHKVKAHFETAGTVIWAALLPDKKWIDPWTGAPGNSGKACVEMATAAEAQSAMITLQGSEIEGRAIKLDKWTDGWKKA